MLVTCRVSRLMPRAHQRADSELEKATSNIGSTTDSHKDFEKATQFVCASVSSSAKQGQYLCHKGVIGLQNNYSV